jgi:hypothetical protein
MKIETIETKVLKAAEGKILRRISDGYEAGKEIYLGKTWYLGGKKLDEPIDELPEHYEEIDDPYTYDEEGNRIYETQPTAEEVMDQYISKDESAE